MEGKTMIVSNNGRADNTRRIAHLGRLYSVLKYGDIHLRVEGKDCTVMRIVCI